MTEKQHPLEHFAYCPVCGSNEFEVNNVKSKRCARCGFVYYANPSAATAAFIVRPSQQTGGERELLVVRRAKEPAKGTLDLPGGFTDMDETVEQGMRREIEEETGLVVGPVHYLFSIPNLYLYSGITIHTLDFFFYVPMGSAMEGQAADDVAECMWVPLSRVRPELFGLNSIRQAVTRVLSGQVLPAE